MTNSLNKKNIYDKILLVIKMNEIFEIDNKEAYKLFLEIYSDKIKNKNKDEYVEIKLTKEQAKRGIEKEMICDYIDYCLHDNDDAKKCSKCFGYGLDIHNTEKITLKIPAKVKHNDEIVLKNKGSRYDKNDERGKLHILIKIYGNKSEKKRKKNI